MNAPLGGRLRFFLHAWYQYTSDKQILSWLSGIKIPFLQRPCSNKNTSRIALYRDQETFLRHKIKQLMHDDCIEQIPAFDPTGFINNVFLRPKRSGGYRMILNVKEFNKFIPDIHFKMEHLPDLFDMLYPNDKIVKLDLQDAFFVMPMSRDCYKYFQFSVKNAKYRFKCAAQGFKLSPFIFCKIVKPLVSYCRAQGIRCLIYIDDMILIGQHDQKCTDDAHIVSRLFQECGFLINWDKSDLEPKQTQEVLGFVIDTTNMTAHLPDDKVRSYTKFIDSCLKSRFIPIRVLAKLIGIFISCTAIFPQGKLFFRDLEGTKVRALSQNNNSWDAVAELTAENFSTIHWWRSFIQENKPYRFTKRSISLEAFSDSSLSGWGFKLANTTISHPFSTLDSTSNINDLEMRAILYGLQTFQNQLQHQHLLLHCDNTTCIADLQNFGSMKSKIRDSLVKQVYSLLESKDCDLTVTYIKSAQNVDADAASRVIHNERTEWSFSDRAFLFIKKFII